MRLYPIKQLKDDSDQPFFPFQTLDSVLENGTNRTLKQIIDDIEITKADITYVDDAVKDKATIQYVDAQDVAMLAAAKKYSDDNKELYLAQFGTNTYEQILQAYKDLKYVLVYDAEGQEDAKGLIYTPVRVKEPRENPSEFIFSCPITGGEAVLSYSAMHPNGNKGFVPLAVNKSYIIAQTNNLTYTYAQILDYSKPNHSQKWSNTEFPITDLTVGCGILIPLIVKEDGRRVVILGKVTAKTDTSCEVQANILIEDSDYITQFQEQIVDTNSTVAQLDTKINTNITAVDQLNSKVTANSTAVSQLDTKVTEHSTSINNAFTEIHFNTHAIDHITEEQDTQNKGIENSLKYTDALADSLFNTKKTVGNSFTFKGLDNIPVVSASVNANKYIKRYGCNYASFGEAVYDKDTVVPVVEIPEGNYYFYSERIDCQNEMGNQPSLGIFNQEGVRILFTPLMPNQYVYLPIQKGGCSFKIYPGGMEGKPGTVKMIKPRIYPTTFEGIPAQELPYEPYVGGTADPSVEYPAQIVNNLYYTVLRFTSHNIMRDTALWQYGLLDNSTGGYSKTIDTCIYPTKRIPIPKGATHLSLSVAHNSGYALLDVFFYNSSAYAGFISNEVFFAQEKTVAIPAGATYFLTQVVANDPIDIPNFLKRAKIQVTTSDTVLPYAKYNKSNIPLAIPGDSNIPMYHYDSFIVARNPVDGKYWRYMKRQTRVLKLRVADIDPNSGNDALIPNIPELLEDFPGTGIQKLQTFYSDITNDFIKGHATEAFSITNYLSRVGLQLNYRHFKLSAEQWLAQYPDLTITLCYKRPTYELVPLGVVQGAVNIPFGNSAGTAVSLNTDVATCAVEYFAPATEPVQKLIDDTTEPQFKKLTDETKTLSRRISYKQDIVQCGTNLNFLWDDSAQDYFLDIIDTSTGKSIGDLTQTLASLESRVAALETKPAAQK